MLVSYHITSHCRNSDGHNLNLHLCEHFKSYVVSFIDLEFLNADCDILRILFMNKFLQLACVTFFIAIDRAGDEAIG